MVNHPNRSANKTVHDLAREIRERADTTVDPRVTAYRRIMAGLPSDIDPFIDHTKSGIFQDHRCWKCNDGERACCQGSPNRCEYPRARND